eukprot:scaffold5829_cov128-Skeletonema_menzelii.AAC.1
MMDVENNSSNQQKIKFLFDRLKEQLAHQRRRHEQSMRMAEAAMENTTCSGLESDSDSDEDSEPLKNTIRMSSQSSCAEEKKASVPQVIGSEVQSSPSPPPISVPLPLPFITFKEDDCDEAEKLARAKRIEVIMKLSAEAKAKEAEKKRVANIKPLSWDKPRFDYPSSTSSLSIAAAATATTTTSSEAAQASTPGKRKSRQEELPRSYPYSYFTTARTPTEEELQSLVDFADTCFPKRRKIDKSGDDSENPESA